MRFLVDENVRKEVTIFLESSGHDVLNVAGGLQDDKVAQTAKETKRIILTHDQHFADILMYPPEEYSGIIRIRIHPPNAPTIIKALGNFLPHFTSEKLDKKLVILEKDSFRIR